VRFRCPCPSSPASDTAAAARRAGGVAAHPVAGAYVADSAPSAGQECWEGRE